MDRHAPQESSRARPAGSEALARVRIFVSSPGDVAEERSVALSVIHRLQGHFQGRLVLVPILWEQQALLAHAGFQEEIDRLAPPSSTDVALFVLWSRLGTPLGPDFVLEDGSRPTGTEWEFETALRAFRERGAPHLLVYRKREAPDVKVTDPHFEERRADWSQLQAFFQRHFRDASDLTFTGSYHHFDDAAQFGQLLEEHLSQILLARLGQGAAEATWRGTPFRGLEAFEAEHAPIFFGRTRAIQEVRRALVEQVGARRAFVLILGQSGNGKSSLARAGLLPLIGGPWLVEEGVQGGFCRRAVMHPGARRNPLEAFASALLAADALTDLRSHGDAPTLADLFAESPRACLSLVEGALHRLSERHRQEQRVSEPPAGRLLLLVDQLEELFTREGAREADRQAFVDVLDVLARSGCVYVLCTLRSDFYPAFSRYPKLMALKEGAGHYDLPSVDAAETGLIVRAPAQVGGLRYEVDAALGRGLDELLVAEATKSPDALPLLEYALTQLEERKADGVLTFRAYEELGGLEGAVARRAEEEWASLPEEAQQAFPSVLRALAEVGDGADARATRRRAPVAELESIPGAAALVERFVAARLLVAEGDGDGATVAVAHEALLRTWPRMADRIEAEAELLRLRSHLRTYAARWVGQNREASLVLARGKPLDEARLLLAAGHALTDVEMAYIAASEAHARRAIRARRLAVSAIAVLAAAASFLALLAFGKQREAEESAATARFAQEEAEGNAALVAAERDAKDAALRRVRAAGLLMASRDVEADQPMLGLLLAREALRTDIRTPRVTVVREALLGARERLLLNGQQSAIECAVFSPAGNRILTAYSDGSATLWDLEGRVVSYLRGHEAGIIDAAFSPDGSQILTGSYDATARLWDLEGRELAVCRGHGKHLNSVAFSPNGRRILTAAEDKTARAWNLAGRELLVIRGHAGRVPSAVFSPDGSRILTTTAYDYVARLWDMEGREVETFRGHVGHVRSAVFSPDGKRLVTASTDRTARLWDLEGREVAVMRGHRNPVASAVFSPDGSRVLTTSRPVSLSVRDGFEDSTARIWDLDGRELAVLDGHESRVLSATFSPDGRQIMTASEDRTARVWDLAGKERTVLRGHTSWISSAMFSPDGTQALTAGGDGTARLWALQGGEMAVLHGHDGVVNDVTFSGDASQLLTASRDGTARLWDLGGRQLAVLRAHEGAVTSAVFSGDSHRILTASEDGTARLWDRDGRTSTVLRGGHKEGFLQAAFAPRGGRVLTWHLKDKVARLWDLRGQQVSILHGHAAPVPAAAFSPDGSRILTGSYDATARLWDLEGRPLPVLRGHDSGILSVAFSPDGSRIVTGGADGTARLWDLEGRALAVFACQGSLSVRAVFSPDGAHVLTTEMHESAVRLWDLEGREIAVLRGEGSGFDFRAELSPNGEFVLTRGARDGAARLWDREGRDVATLRVRDASVTDAVFSPDGKRLATVSDDGTARLWDLGGRELAVLIGHESLVVGVEFSPIGHRILTCSTDRTARLWDLEGNEIIVLEGHEDTVDSAVFSSDGTRILTRSADGTAGLWDPERGDVMILSGPEECVESAAFSPDESSVLTTSEDGTARLWGLDGRQLSTFPGGRCALSGAEFSRDGRRIVAFSEDRTARVWDLDGREVATLRWDGISYKGGAAVFSPDGRRVLTAAFSERTARLWDLEDPRAPIEMESDRNLYSAAFSPDGTRILAAYGDAARLWDLEGREIAAYRGHEAGVRSARFSPDGTRVLTASYDKTARLWALNGREKTICRGHDDTLNSAVFSPDGKWILTASDDRTARLWDLEGREVGILRGHEGPVTHAVFSANGDHIATASKDGSARVYLVHAEDLLRLADARVTREFTPAERERYADLLGGAE